MCVYICPMCMCLSIVVFFVVLYLTCAGEMCARSICPGNVHPCRSGGSQQMNCLYFPLQKEASEMAFQQVNSIFIGTAVQGV